MCQLALISVVAVMPYSFEDWSAYWESKAFEGFKTVDLGKVEKAHAKAEAAQRDRHQLYVQEISRRSWYGLQIRPRARFPMEEYELIATRQASRVIKTS